MELADAFCEHSKKFKGFWRWYVITNVIIMLDFTIESVFLIIITFRSLVLIPFSSGRKNRNPLGLLVELG
jgi:hypothetical protein